MTVNKGTDARPPFFSIEDAVVDKYELGPLAGWLYVVIAKHINRKTNEAFPSLTRLAKMAGMSRASVIRNIKVLEEKHLIEVTREVNPATKEKEVNHYRLMPATKGVVSDSNQGSIGGKLGVVSDRDINHKNLNQNNDPAPIGAVAEVIEFPAPASETKVKRTRKPDPLFDAVRQHIFGIDDPNAEGGRIGKISNWLAGKYEGKSGQKVGKIGRPAEPKHVEAFAKYCKGKGITPPRDFVKFVEAWREWATSFKSKPTITSMLQDEEPVDFGVDSFVRKAVS
jgi:hypothetical protein